VLDTENVPLAAIAYQRGFEIDDLLLACCAELRSLGFRIGRLVQRSSGTSGQCPTEVSVVDLRSGDAFNIWEDRGACARGCRLDERGLIDAEPSIMSSLADGVDLIVINRFGRAESLGRGLLGCFAAAIEARVALLTAVRAPYEEAWHSFHGGCALQLAPKPQNIIDWAIASIAKSGLHAQATHTYPSEENIRPSGLSDPVALPNRPGAFLR
jgi:hypothetical protein